LKGSREMALLKWFDREVARLLSPMGPVGKDLQKLANDLTLEAQQLAPVRTGRLRASIRATFRPSGLGVDIQVGSHVGYGLVQERRRPHLRPALQSALTQFRAEQKIPSGGTGQSGGFSWAE
jgi:hypothetical protein